MSSVKMAVAGVLVMLITGPLMAQVPPGMLEGGTYNTPAGAGARPPAYPTYPPSVGQPPLLFPPSFPQGDILNPNQQIWLQQFRLREGQRGVRPGEEEGRARITVRVPTAATQLWVNGQPTRQQGRERLFITPPLEPGTYRYRFRVSWLADRTPRSATQTVTFRPDASLVVDFASKSRPAAR